MVTLGGAQKPAQTFRMSWLRLYAAMTFWIVVLLLLMLVPAFPIPTIAAGLVAGALLEAVFAILLVAFYPIRVGTQGIYAFNFWGVRGGMAWDEIASVKPLSFIGLPYLIVRSNRTKNALWLPLFFTNNEAFRRAIVQFAPPNSPLLPSD